MIDCRLGRLFGVLLAVGFYTTGSLKTLFCLPRPPSPPIRPLEDAYDWLVVYLYCKQFKVHLIAAFIFHQ